MSIAAVTNSRRHRGSVIEGRDVTGALVDCSALLPDVEYYNIGVLEFVKKVVAPFGIDVTLQPASRTRRSPSPRRPAAMTARPPARGPTERRGDRQPECEVSR
jgi:hypothetical protein